MRERERKRERERERERVQAQTSSQVKSIRNGHEWPFRGNGPSLPLSFFSTEATVRVVGAESYEAMSYEGEKSEPLGHWSSKGRKRMQQAPFMLTQGPGPRNGSEEDKSGHSIDSRAKEASWHRRRLE